MWAWRSAQKLIHILFLHNHRNLDKVLHLDETPSSKTEFSFYIDLQINLCWLAFIKYVVSTDSLMGITNREFYNIKMYYVLHISIP